MIIRALKGEVKFRYTLLVYIILLPIILLLVPVLIGIFQGTTGETTDHETALNYTVLPLLSIATAWLSIALFTCVRYENSKLVKYAARFFAITLLLLNFITVAGILNH